MANIPIPQQIYRHFKGKLYQIVSVAEHTETGEQLVIYQALYGDFKVYARPLSMFMEKVDRVKYPDAEQEYRFEQVVRAGIETGEGIAESRAVDTCKWAETQILKAAADFKGVSEDISSENTHTAEALDIDPLVLEFLDAGTYEERLNILAALHHRITDDMINTMALAVDVEVQEGDIEERYAELRKCLLLYDKFECTRLR